MTTGLTLDSEQTLNQEIGDRVHALMWRRKMTQTALAPYLGVSQSALAQKLRGKIGWSARDLMDAAAALDVQVSDLLPPGPANKNSPTNPGEAVLRSAVSSEARLEGLEPPTS